MIIRSGAVAALASLALALAGVALSASAASGAGSGSAAAPAPNSATPFGSAQAVDAASTTPAGQSLDTPVVAIASTADAGGYWLATASGQVASSGDAANQGSLSGVSLNAPIVAIAADAASGGYWLASGAGGVFSFGAPFHGSVGATPLHSPIVGMAATPGGGGYWLVGSDGGIFSYGDAAFHGSAGATPLNAPIVGMAATPDGGGYWLVASDGGIFTYGDAAFEGSAGGMQINSPIVGMAPTPDGGGYWLVAADGAVYSFGDAPFEGAATSATNPPTVGIAPRSAGYWLATGQYSDTSTTHLQQLLAALGYLPVDWTAPGQTPGSPTNAELALDEPASSGTFSWQWANPPPSLSALWQPGVYNVMVSGAVMAFEAQQGLPLDGQASPTVWAHLDQAAESPSTGSNTAGYTYALATKALPETLTVWHNGTQVDSAGTNTGIPSSPTADGTFPVYERLRSQIMRGTNPNGSSYADPVQWVAYFNGGDAVHYIARSYYGSPQSLGCLEVSYDTGETVWPYLTYGSLVTVSG